MTNQETILSDIQKQITDNKIMLFMKGTKHFPRCGFSGTMVEIFNRLGVDYGAMDILPDPMIRQILSEHSNWPTIPQVFVAGEFVGGCDIVRDMYMSGDLQKKLQDAGIEVKEETPQG